MDGSLGSAQHIATIAPNFVYEMPMHVATAITKVLAKPTNILNLFCRTTKQNFLAPGLMVLLHTSHKEALTVNIKHCYAMREVFFPIYVC